MLKAILDAIIEQLKQWQAARREAVINRQEEFVAQLGGAYEEHPFPDYLERYQQESKKLNRIQRI